MSLINQMLEDLEKRGEGATRSGEPPARYAQFGTPILGSRNYRLIFLLILLCVSAAVGIFLLKEPGAVSVRRVEQISDPKDRPNAVPTTIQEFGSQTDAIPISTLPLLLKLSTDLQQTEIKSATDNSEEKNIQQLATEQARARDPAPSVDPKTPENRAAREVKLPVIAEVRRSDGSVVDLSAIDSNGSDVKPRVSDEAKPNTRMTTKSTNSPDKHIAAPIMIVKEVSPQQRAEGEYKQATIYQQQGRNSEAILALEQALKLDAGHAPARQLMISLFLDAKRYDDAIRELKVGLTIDSHQINFAMILARLLVERAKIVDAVDVLQKSVVYAKDRPDYLAFLAALLQKLNRHKDAVQYYRLAISMHGQNGVWWMGMGISLQAEGANQEALEAYRQAQD